jgi:PKD repeat protein
MRNTFTRTGIAALLASGITLAQSAVVLPDGYANAVENTANAFPFGSTSTNYTGLRVLYTYDSSHFTNQSVGFPIRIQGLRFRAADTTSTWVGGTYATVTIQLSTAAVDYSAVTTTWANNHGPDLTTVHSGPVTVLPGSGGGIGVIGPWFVDVPLTTPFVYDPTTGSDLCIDVDNVGVGNAWSGGSTTTMACVNSSGTPPSNASRVYGSTQYPNANGTDSTALVVEVVYQPASGLFAAFAADVHHGPSPLAVNFTDQTFTSDPGGVVAWAWDFENDGTIDSSVQNPTFVYPQCGSYDVALTAFDASHAPNTLVRQALIRPDWAPCTPSFTYAVIAPGVYQFTDTTTPVPSAWEWDLDGDGTVDATVQHPAWAYASPCTAARVTLGVYHLCHGPVTSSQQIALAPRTFALAAAPNSGQTGSAGSLFDIDVTNPDGISICALSLYPYTATATASCEVWLSDAPGGFAANYQNQALWRRVATGQGSSTGTYTTPAVFVLDDPIYIPFGRYAMAIGTNAGIRYVMLAANSIDVGPDCTVTCGRSAGPLFSAGYANRGFAGTFHYSTVGGGDPAGYGFFGAGCAGSRGISTLSPAALPAIGSLVDITVSNLPQNVAIMLTGFSRSAWALGALPFDVSALGAPGCSLRVSPDATLVLVGTGNQAILPFGVPAAPVLVGVQMFHQVLVLDPGFNAAGAVGSDAFAVLIGS